MITFKSLLQSINEDAASLVLYRGVDPKYGDVEHGKRSIGRQHKLVGALGPNYTDSKEVAQRYGKQIIVKVLSSPRILTLDDYNDIMLVYKKYENQMTPGIAGMIRMAIKSEEFPLIKKAAKELRDILKKDYDLVKSPLGKGDAEYLASKGLKGDLYILLNY